MKRDECILATDKQHNAFSFSFFANKFISFFVSKMSIEENFVKKL